MGEQVLVCEVGPRDGLQMASGRMATEAKIHWIAAMAAAGLREIEVGSFVPARVIPQMADTDPVVRATISLPGVAITALAPNLRGAQAAYAAGAHRVSIPVSLSEGHSRANLNRTPAEQVAEVGRVVAWVRAQPRPMAVAAACSTAFGCSIDGAVPERAVLSVASGLAAAGVEAGRTAPAAIDDDAHAGHGQRGFGAAGGEHHTTTLGGAKGQVLLGRRQLAVQREDEGAAAG